MNPWNGTEEDFEAFFLEILDNMYSDYQMKYLSVRPTASCTRRQDVETILDRYNFV